MVTKKSSFLNAKSNMEEEEEEWFGDTISFILEWIR